MQSWRRSLPRQSQRSQASKRRFLIRLPDLALEPQPKAEVPGAVLNKALRLAEKADEPGVWEVIEWEDVVYRVHRLENPEKKLDVRVEIIR